MTVHPDFAQELQRPFDVHDHCYDCGEFYDGCNAWPAGKTFRCADYLRLPDVMPGTYGQVFPPSRMKGRKKPREIQDEPVERQPAPPERQEPAEPKARTCDCGAALAKGKRLCDACRTEGRRRTKRQYMRGYMGQRRFGISTLIQEGPNLVRNPVSMGGSGHDLPLTRPSAGGDSFPRTSVLTGAR